MGFSPSLLLYEWREGLRAGRRQKAVAARRPAKRPSAQLAWFHVDRDEDWNVVQDLMASLADDLPDLSFLLTTAGEKPRNLPDWCAHETLPNDDRGSVVEFLDFWQPDISVWIPGRIRPVAVQICADRNIPTIMIDTGGAFGISQACRWFPFLKRRTLRSFHAILSGDEATTVALVSAGARRDRVDTTGILQSETSALPCNQAEWDAMIDLLGGRPVWLAASVDLSELDSVIAAHKQALRKSHRLLLVIVPGDVDEGDEFAAALRKAGMVMAQRSLGNEPGKDVQVYLADTADEMGLWFRLAPVTFMGRTQDGTSGKSPNPFDAAALGSVVAHGPNIGAHEVEYQRLARAGASREISHMGELGHALDDLLAPDRAAIMAHAAWQISSAGADVMKQARTVLRDVLAKHKAPAR